jgi:hypothetical protein
MSFAQPPFRTDPIDLSLDQALGLDLAPGYDYGFSSGSDYGMDTTLGLDMLGSGVGELPRQKTKKVAWVEIKRLIDGKWTSSRILIRTCD